MLINQLLTHRSHLDSFFFFFWHADIPFLIVVQSEVCSLSLELSQDSSNQHLAMHMVVQGSKNKETDNGGEWR